MRAARIAVGDLDEAHVAAFLSRPSRRRRKHPARPALHQFFEYLRSIARAVVPRRRSDPSPAEELVGSYVDHLRDYQGLCPRSIEVYSSFVRAFVKAQRHPEGGAALDAVAVRSYLLDHSRTRSVSFVKLPAAALRSFLRFCFFGGMTASDLSTAVPPIRRWQLASVPPFLTAEEVERVMAAIDRLTTRGRRAVAILLLLARLGLRAGEVVARELDDIRWDVGEILVRGKGRLHDRLPLLEDVGEALALCLREARGPSASRRVFLSHRTPPVGLAISSLAGRSITQHTLRHTAAMDLLRRGVDPTVIALWLGHESVETTQIYLHADMRPKQRALGHAAPSGSTPTR